MRTLHFLALIYACSCTVGVVLAACSHFKPIAKDAPKLNADSLQVYADSLEELSDSLKAENELLRRATGRCITTLEGLQEQQNGCGEVWRQRHRRPWSGGV